MAYEMVMPYHLHMPSYFLETFTEYPSAKTIDSIFAEIRAYRHCYKNAVSFSVMQT